MIIDVHAHALKRESLIELGFKALGKDEYVYPSWSPGPLDKLVYDIEARLESLKERGIDLQLVGPPPRLISNRNKVLNVEFCRLLNKNTAELVEESGGRLGGMAVPALGEPGKAAEELRRSVGEYGFKGATIGTSAGGRVLDSPEFEPLFAMIEKLGLLVFMHSTPGALNDALNDYTLRTLVGFPFETTLTVSRLIFSGMLERHPNFHLVLSHGGGTLPYLQGRLNRGYFAPKYEYNAACHANISKPPGEYFRQLYFDTCVLSPKSLRFLVEVVGSDRVMFGSDFPFEIGDAEGALAIPAIKEMPEETQEKIMGNNAAAILKL